MLKAPPLTKALQICNIPFWSAITKFQMCQQWILLPHVFFAMLFACYREVFDTNVLGSVADLQEFWADMAGNPQYEEHPVKTRPNHRSKTIPLTIHGDGLPAIAIGKTWQRSFEAFSWCSLTTHGMQTLLVNWLIWIYPKDLVAKGFPSESFCFLTLPRPTTLPISNHAHHNGSMNACKLY